MGLNFSLKNANAVGYLIEGNLMTFLKESSQSNELNEPNIEFIDNLVRNTQGDFYISELFWRELYPNINRLREQWENVRNDFRQLTRREGKNFEAAPEYSRRLLIFLSDLSSLLRRCKVKTLLLPGFENSKLDNRMYERNFLRELVNIHPGDSALILQIKERLERRNISILNVFPKFEKAYNSIDLWPGVLLWNDNESMFVKVDSEREIFDIYEILRFENGSFNYLGEKYGHRQKGKKNAYFFHLSDLHFGNSDSNRRKLRLSKILETHLSELSANSMAVPIITGDLVDSPTRANVSTYFEFCESLKDKGFEKPIQILGNHDVDTSGIMKRLTTQKSVISQLVGNSNVDVVKDLNLAFVKFNSNFGGNLAQGEIGEDQFIQLGNEIDSIKDRENLNYIALVHHHPKEIDNPEWYKKDWYEALLGNSNFQKTMKLVDAERFLDWIERRKIKLVLHGHKHIPNIQEYRDITIIASGSSTGKVRHREAGKTYLTYNLIKYSLDQQRPVSCSIIAEENLGSGTKNMLLHLL